MSNFIFLGDFNLLGINDVYGLYIDLDKYCFIIKKNYKAYDDYIIIESPIIVIGSKYYQIDINYNNNKYNILLNKKIIYSFTKNINDLILSPLLKSQSKTITTSFYIYNDNIYFFDKNDNTYKLNEKLFKRKQSLLKIKNSLKNNDYHIKKNNLIIYTKKGVEVIYEKSSSSSPKERILVEFKSPPQQERILVEFKLRSTSSEKRRKNATTLQAVVKRRIENDKLKKIEIATTLLQAVMKRNKPMKELKDKFDAATKIIRNFKISSAKKKELKEQNETIKSGIIWGSINKKTNNDSIFLKIKNKLKENFNEIISKTYEINNKDYKINSNIVSSNQKMYLYGNSSIIYINYNIIIKDCILYFENASNEKIFFKFENKNIMYINKNNLPEYTFVYNKQNDKLKVYVNELIYSTIDDNNRVDQFLIHTI